MYSPELSIANRLRNLTTDLEPVNLGAIADSMKCDVREKTLRASEGGLQGMVFPIADRYSVIIDPNPAPSDAEEVQVVGISAVRRFRLAHELAHVATGTFSNDGLRNERMETYCDLIASAVLVESVRAAEAVESDDVPKLACLLSAPVRAVIMSASLAET